MNLLTLGKLCSLALLIAILVPASPASAQMDPVDLGVKIGGSGKSVVCGKTKDRDPAGRSDKVRPIYIDGNRVFLLPIHIAKRPCCRLDFDLKTRFKGRLWLVAAAVATGGSKVDMTGGRN